MVFVERMRYAFDDDDSDWDSASRRQSGLAVVVFSGWNDDGGIGGYVDAILQKGQDGDGEDMVLSLFLWVFLLFGEDVGDFSLLRAHQCGDVGPVLSWIALSDIFNVLLFQSLVGKRDVVYKSHYLLTSRFKSKNCRNHCKTIFADEFRNRTSAVPRMPPSIIYISQSTEGRRTSTTNTSTNYRFEFIRLSFQKHHRTRVLFTKEIKWV